MATTTFSGPVVSTGGFQGTVTATSANIVDLVTTGEVTIDGTTVVIADLPTSDPSVAGQLWVDGSANYVIKVSQGA